MGKIHFGRYFGTFEAYFSTPLECGYFDEHDPRTQRVATLDEVVILVRKAWKQWKLNPIWAHVGEHVNIGFQPVDSFTADFRSADDGEISYRGKTIPKSSKDGCHKVVADEMAILSPDNDLIGAIYDDFAGEGPQIYLFANLDKFTNEDGVSTGIRYRLQRVWEEITSTCES